MTYHGPVIGLGQVEPPIDPPEERDADEDYEPDFDPTQDEPLDFNERRDREWR